MMIPDGASTSQQAIEEGYPNETINETCARSLLSERGYKLIKRVHHIHARRGEQEWHICLAADLPKLTQEQFLQRFEEALSFRISTF